MYFIYVNMQEHMAPEPGKTALYWYIQINSQSNITASVPYTSILQLALIEMSYVLTGYTLLTKIGDQQIFSL